MILNGRITQIMIQTRSLLALRLIAISPTKSSVFETTLFVGLAGAKPADHSYRRLPQYHMGRNLMQTPLDLLAK